MATNSEEASYGGGGPRVLSTLIKGCLYVGPLLIVEGSGSNRMCASIAVSDPDGENEGVCSTLDCHH